MSENANRNHDPFPDLFHPLQNTQRCDHDFGATEPLFDLPYSAESIALTSLLNSLPDRFRSLSLVIIRRS
jgi:hypothetical protein